MYQRRDSRLNPSLDHLRDLSKYYIESKDAIDTARNIKPEDSYWVDMLLSLNQLHIVECLRKLNGKKKQAFIKRIQELNFEQIDTVTAVFMQLYFNAIKNREIKHIYSPYSGTVLERDKLDL